MADVASTNTMTQNESDDEMTIEEMFAEMRVLNRQMARDQADIDRLKAENAQLRVQVREKLDELKAVMRRC